ncbi:MAG TPA: hypothetical protein VJ370_17520, partial [Streptosporangiaceae bacterium]|nr:hypothetical protein [Streptosporangiaceae bacterium]
TPSRPAAGTAAAPPSAPGQGTQGTQGSPGSGPSQPDKRTSARAGVLDSGEHPDGIRLVPGSEN